MKQLVEIMAIAKFQPAAFGRLCVETKESFFIKAVTNPAAFGRLCVETTNRRKMNETGDPAAFGRLCVEILMTVP